jgi:hypothetical protein
MSCCGQKRRRYHKRMSGQVYESGETTPTGPPPGTVFFEYVGGTAMTVVGPATGHRYRFGWPGAQIAVDLKDARALAAGVPHLRKVEEAN